MSTISPPNSLLGATSRWTASVRALESTRDDRLFDGPWEATPADLRKSRRTTDLSWARSCGGKGSCSEKDSGVYWNSRGGYDIEPAGYGYRSHEFS